MHVGVYVRYWKQAGLGARAASAMVLNAVLM